VKLGIVGRANDRGLGVQSLNAWRNLPFERALVVTDDNWRWPEYPERYEDDSERWVEQMHVVKRNSWAYDEEQVRGFLDGLDLVFTVEGFHDWRICDWARDMGVKTLIQGNPEFYRHHRIPQPEPDAWTWPTDWLVNELPPGRIVPVPIAGDSWARAGSPDDDRLTILHVAGHRANGDRNGTESFYDALRFVTANVNIRVVGQDGQLPDVYRLKPNLRLEEIKAGVEDRWSMYDGAHLVVLPRRYGGNCMPAYEAMEAG
jgi:hypothetical protein